MAGPGPRPRTSPRATTRTCGRSASSPSCSARSGSCPTSRSHSATSASRPGRSRNYRRSASASAVRPSSGRGRSSSSARPSWRSTSPSSSSHFPVAGFDLPVVEATVEPDPRLVHRLVLLLGRRRHGHGRRRHRGLSSVDGIIRISDLARPVADPVARHAAFIVLDHHARSPRPSSTPSACGCWRSSTTSVSAPRSSGCSSSR